MYSVLIAQQSKWMSSPPRASVARPLVTSHAVLTLASTNRDSRADASACRKRKPCCSLKRGPRLAEKSRKMALISALASRSPRL